MIMQVFIFENDEGQSFFAEFETIEQAQDFFRDSDFVAAFGLKKNEATLFLTKFIIGETIEHNKKKLSEYAELYDNESE